MKFEYDKKQIQQIAAEHSYTATNVEKVIRLCLILEDLNNLDEFAETITERWYGYKSNSL